MLSVRTLLVAVLAFLAIQYVSAQSATEKINALKERAFTEVSAEAPSCDVNGRTGICIDVATCKGTPVKGHCEGKSNIQCCLPSAFGTTAVANAAAVATAPRCAFGIQTGVCVKKTNCLGGTLKAGLCKNSPADVQCCLSPIGTGASATPVRRPLPPPGSQCTAFGKKGTCQEIVSCKNGRPYPGWCGGPASIQCCIPNEVAPIKPGAYTSKALNKITRPAVERQAESETLAKFNAFNAKYNKKYASEAKKAEAYAAFKTNRLKNIERNDKYGKGNAIFSSVTPFANIPNHAFNALYKGVRIPRKVTPAPGRSLIEAQAEAEAEAGNTMWEPTEAQLEEAREIIRRAEQSDVSFISHGAGVLVQEGEACGDANKGICQGADNCLNAMGTPITGTCKTEGNICCIPPGPVTPGQFDASGATVTGALEVDFRNLLTPVKNQKSCGSCWAFTATAVVESAYTRATGKSLVLSPQQLVDCETKSSGCAGGFPGDAFDYLKTVRQATEAEYPYTAIKAATCAKPEGGSGPKTKGAVTISICPDYAACADADNKSATKLLAGLKEYGPLAVALDASKWQTYKGGIFPASTCSPAWTAIDHAVQLVGFGSEGGKKFWLIRNSWDTWWGEQGFIRLEAFSGGSCGIANYAQATVYNPDTSAPAAPAASTQAATPVSPSAPSAPFVPSVGPKPFVPSAAPVRPVV